MTTAKILEKIKPQKIGKTPVVVLPFKIWQDIEDRLEELAMIHSKTLRRKIAKVRVEKKLYSSSQVKEMLGI